MAAMMVQYPQCTTSNTQNAWFRTHYSYWILKLSTDCKPCPPYVCCHPLSEVTLYRLAKTFPDTIVRFWTPSPISDVIVPFQTLPSHSETIIQFHTPSSVSDVILHFLDALVQFHTLLSSFRRHRPISDAFIRFRISSVYNSSGVSMRI